MKKRRHRQGETLVETLTALLIAALTFAFLATAVVTAAKINAATASAQNFFQYDKHRVTEASAVLSQGTKTASGEVTVYQHNGFYYYEIRTPATEESP